MHLLNLTLSTPADNLALDEALLLEAEAGRVGEALRLWEWPRPAVVLGAGCRLAAEVIEAACQADGVPILRRNSGGGTVLLGEGCLLFSLILNYERSPALRDVRSSYPFILNTIGQALADRVPDAELVGISDLAAGGRKFSGNAQQRKQAFLLHHGTLLYGFDLGLVGRYLNQPERQPDYRARREHETFLMNLPLSAAELRARLQRVWEARSALPTWPEQLVRQLAATKYTHPEWTRRR